MTGGGGTSTIGAHRDRQSLIIGGHMRLGSLFLVAVLAALAPVQSAPSGKDPAFHALMDRFTDAWNRHDAHAFAAIFAEDADFTNVIGTGAHGRDAIERFHAPLFATLFANSRLTYSEMTARLVRPDVAAVDVRWQMTGATDPQGRLRPPREGLLNFVMEQHEGQWRILVMHNMNLDVPSTPGSPKAVRPAPR